MIGYCECEFKIFGTLSLKEKRAVMQRTLTRVKQKYNVSAAEIGHQDLWQLTRIALVTVTSSKKASERELNQAIGFLDSFPEWERIKTDFEWL